MQKEIRIFEKGGPFFDFLFEKISEAKEEILISTYVVKSDRVGQRLFHVLKESVKRGVKVKLLYDTLESRDFSESDIDDLRASGVEIFPFRSFFNFFFRHPLAFLYRSHGRIFLIDDEWVVLGSMSIGETYLEREDLMIAFPNPPREYFADCFAYLRALAGKCEVLVPSFLLSGLPARLEESILLLWSGPRPTEQQLYPHLLKLIRGAREKIVIVTAFFFPTVQMVEELIAASERGVAVSVITPLRTDKGKYDRLRGLPLISLTKKGIHWYGTKQYFHEKFVLADEKWLTGSANIDIIGLLRDYEVNYEGVGGKIGESLNSIAARLMHDQEPITQYSAPIFFRSFHRFFYRLVEFFFVPR